MLYGRKSFCRLNYGFKHSSTAGKTVYIETDEKQKNRDENGEREGQEEMQKIKSDEKSGQKIKTQHYKTIKFQKMYILNFFFLLMHTNIR